MTSVRGEGEGGQRQVYQAGIKIVGGEVRRWVDGYFMQTVKTYKVDGWGEDESRWGGCGGLQEICGGCDGCDGCGGW
jgi:uncharacterized lipoprotein YddW (UPF0748 family)